MYTLHIIGLIIEFNITYYHLSVPLYVIQCAQVRNMLLDTILYIVAIANNNHTILYSVYAVRLSHECTLLQYLSVLYASLIIPNYP